MGRSEKAALSYNCIEERSRNPGSDATEIGLELIDGLNRTIIRQHSLSSVSATTGQTRLR